MKRVVWWMLVLALIISVSASYLPQPGAIFTFKGATCYTNGTMLINITHEGTIVAFSSINMTVESDELSKQIMHGEWLVGNYPREDLRYPDNNYTGTDISSKSRFFYKTTTPMFTKGKYIVTLMWPSNTIYYEKIMFAVECPGKPCNSNDNCISEQRCENQTCKWIKCTQDNMAMGHVCQPKCNDYDSCTQDYYINGKCTFIKIDNCPAKTGLKETNLFKIIWNWLKSRY